MRPGTLFKHIHESFSLDARRSPLFWVIESVEDYILNIAPERQNDLKKICRDLTLEINDEMKWKCSINPATKVMRLSLGACEMLWGIVYSNCLLYDKDRRRQLFGDSFSPHDDPEIWHALEQYRWALLRFAEGKHEPWESIFVKPKMPNRDLPDGNDPPVDEFATEMFLCALAVMLHHELAHHYCLHRSRLPAPKMRAQEAEADQEAVNWITRDLNILNVPSEIRSTMETKRGLGAAFLLLSLTALESYSIKIHGDNTQGRTHPYSYERMLSILEGTVKDPTHLIWFLTVSCLRTNFWALNLELPRKTFDIPKECAENLVRILADFQISA